jgi:hypothetical protein
MRYFGDDGERMQMTFNFHVNQHLFYALAAADSATCPGAQCHRAASGHSAMGFIPAQPRQFRVRAHLDEKPRETSFASGVSGEAGKLLVKLLSEDQQLGRRQRPA